MDSDNKDNDEPPKLRLVQNNDPGYRPKDLHDKCKKKYHDRITQLEEDLRQRLEFVKELNEARLKSLTTEVQKSKGIRKRYLTRGGIGLASLVLLMGGIYAKCDWDDNPEEFNILYRDLNRDGINDAYILQEDRHMIPMYGVKTPDGIRYLSAEEMKKNPENIINYENIEEMLNKGF